MTDTIDRMHAKIEDLYFKEILRQQAEIERLRDQVTRLSTLVDTERSLHDAEIERLRLENDGLKLAVKMRPKPELVDDPRQQAIIAEQKAEIERLRSELNMAVVAKHEAEDKADEMFAGCQARDAEIERLQQQDAKLREELSVWLKCYQEEKKKREELVQRVREALEKK